MTLNEHDLYETTALWHKPFWQTTLFYWCFGSVLTIIIFLVFYMGIKKWRKKSYSVFYTPMQQALQDIMLLQQHNLVNGARSKEFYEQLTIILKRFFAQSSVIQSESMTDEELIAYFVRHNMYTDAIADLKNIFTGTAHIKFAHKQGAQEQIERDFRQSIHFIKTCAPQVK